MLSVREEVRQQLCQVHLLGRGRTRRGGHVGEPRPKAVG